MAKVRFPDLITEVESLLAAAAAEYRAPAMSEEARAVLASVDKRVLRKALRLAGGDVRRMTVEEDRSIIVWNYPVW